MVFLLTNAVIAERLLAAGAACYLEAVLPGALY